MAVSYVYRDLYRRCEQQMEAFPKEKEFLMSSFVKEIKKCEREVDEVTTFLTNPLDSRSTGLKLISSEDLQSVKDAKFGPMFSELICKIDKCCKRVEYLSVKNHSVLPTLRSLRTTHPLKRPGYDH